MINCTYYNLFQYYRYNNYKKSAIVINTINDVNEDIYLGRKVNKLLTTLGYCTVMYPLLLKMSNNQQKNLNDYFIRDRKNRNSYDNVRNNKNTIVVVTPIKTDQIIEVVNFLKIIYDQHNLKKNKIFVFSDTANQQIFDVRLFIKLIKKQVSYNTLGLYKNQLGYIPLSSTEIQSLNNNNNLFIKLLCDSLNLDICTKDHFLIGYLNLENYITPILIFLHNSLIEFQSSLPISLANRLNYIFFCEYKITSYELQTIVAECTNSQSIYYIEAKKINFYYYGDNLKLIVSSKTSSESTAIVNIFFTNKILPENIFNCFIKLSNYGIMSGNNSLINYISIKQELPYYCFDKQDILFIQELQEEAKHSKLYNYYKCKFIGEDYFGVSKYNALENNICEKKDFDMYKINYKQQDIKQAKNALKYINIKKYDFENKFINRCANNKIKAILS
jgi:hypothetical protein